MRHCLWTTFVLEKRQWCFLHKKVIVLLFLFCFKRGDGRAVRITADDETMEVMPSLTASPSAPAFLSKEGQASSPILSAKDLRATATLRKKGSAGEVDNSLVSKSERRKSDKEKKVVYDIHALFDAVEQQDLDAVKVILDSNSVDINSLNAENLCPLDIALMTNNIPMARMLLLQGARESPLFQQGGCRLHRLELLVSEAEKRVVDLTAVVLNGTSGNTSISPAQLKENERQLSHWEFRHRLLKRMKAGYDHARPPEPPTQVTLNVASNSSLLVSFDEPLNHNGAVVTKYKVEWSSYQDFLPLSGEAIVEDIRHLEYEIRGLMKGNVYYVRVAACNIKGLGGYTVSTPPYAVPSSWRDVDGTPSRLEGKAQSLQILFDQVKRSRPPEAGEVKDSFNTDSPLQKKRISIKNLFLSAPKFQKGVKRGVHLACLLYCDDKVLVTSEEQLPIIEVDESFSGTSIQNDLYWLMKIAGTWEDVKLLKQDMEKTSSAGSTFRTKLLQAITTLQNSLGMQDLGQFFHRAIRAANGSLILTLVNTVRDTKFVGLGSAKWVSLSKLARRQSLPSTDIGDAHNMLIAAIPEMLMYKDVSTVPLPKGLYLGFLKIQVSVESVRLLVPHKMPNCLPHAKIRDCPNVSREEWEWLQNLDFSKSSSSQPAFCSAIHKAAKKLFSQLGLSIESAGGYRLYDVEVIEMSPSVSFLVLLPPVEQVCMAPGQADHLSESKDFDLLPVQIFETIHMNSYQSQIFVTYARLSAITEMDVVLAQQAQREAFSTEELSLAKEQLEISCHLQQNLERLWKGTRWVMDLITFARDKSPRPPVSATALLIPPDAFSRDLTPSPKPVHFQAGRGVYDNNNSQSTYPVCNSNEISVGKDNRKIAKFFDPNDDPKKNCCGNGGGGSSDEDSALSRSKMHTKSVSRINADNQDEAVQTPPPMTSGILRVYAAYDTGLSKGVSVKLHITAHTTARDVINLVVRHLNMAVLGKGKDGPIYADEDLDNFCLVAVVGSRERVLGDDFQPLKLQNPWLKGRLYVRVVNSKLAAIQQGQATAV
ncbi:ankyrin repeat and fibronectin type-III domain-containing protein 1-like isoform X5 [Pomacea canaliculata]|uniref:ankyrin repeat and fibronectin type-III domain-containing protein 1-like isoform X5 n=1 Tax=Pomacea canaliculata TaxID=400727 RepID=UPI000D72A81C|nr:ankyrin repeat and fibronectin type-III domain-containing protein 1-like isoform X5 [Pomacea canaliculata]